MVDLLVRLFRNAKGHASLERCQARSMNKYRTHFNMSFTSLNCLKMAAKQCGIPYSISNLKTLASRSSDGISFLS